MSLTKVRQWLFNAAPPTPSELIQCQQNAPILHSLKMESDAASMRPLALDAEFYRNPLADLTCHSYSLPCNTSLGLVFNIAGIDPVAPALAGIDPVFLDSRVSVRRMALSTCNSRLFLFEFNWLISGALTIRFVPFGAPPTSPARGSATQLHASGEQLHWPKCNAFAHIFTFAFIPEDALVLSTSAQTPMRDFLSASFDLLGISDRCYRMSIYDTAFQSPCVFCLSRGAAACECPMPLRRRKSLTPDAPKALIAYGTSEPGVVWPQFTRIVTGSRTSGSYVFNLSIGCRKNGATTGVVGSGIFPFQFNITANMKAHPSLQVQFKNAGYSATSPYALISDSRVSPSEHQGLQLQSKPVNVTDGVGKAETDNLQQLVASSPGRTRKRARQMSIPHNALILQAADFPRKGGANSTSDDILLKSHHDVWYDAAAVSALDSGASSMPTLNGSGGEAANAMQDVKMYKCHICHIEIRNKKSNLTRHIANKHGSKRRFVCHATGCDEKFQTRLNLTQHQHDAHSLSEIEERTDRTSSAEGTSSSGESAPADESVENKKEEPSQSLFPTVVEISS